MLGDLYTVPIEGGEATALTEGIEWSFQPRFSPDGTRIAFVSDRGGADNLWVMNADGTDPRPVTEEKENLVHNPGWSPDGDYIVAKKGFTSTRSIAAGRCPPHSARFPGPRSQWEHRRGGVRSPRAVTSDE